MGTFQKKTLVEILLRLHQHYFHMYLDQTTVPMLLKEYKFNHLNFLLLHFLLLFNHPIIQMAFLKQEVFVQQLLELEHSLEQLF
jgi:hypothetical protein